MVNYEPHVSKTARYTIDETSNLLGIHRHTLRRYTKQGKICYSRRHADDRKFYFGKEILRFWRATSINF